MANPAPGVNVNITTAAVNPTNPTSTSTWFVVGMAAGPSGVAVPVKSMSDFTNSFGQIINGSLTGRYTLNANVDSTLLYDALDVFFREGGSSAYVSRVQPTSTGVAAATSAVAGKFIFTAAGKGTWANSSSSNAVGLILTITGYTAGVSTAYSAVIAYSGVTLATTSGLAVDADVVNWVNSLPLYQAMCTAATQSGTTNLPAAGSSVSIYFTAGTDVAVVDADSAVALTAFNVSYGPGQVSFPGATTSAVYNNLTNHAAAFNRVAFLDAANTPSAATIETAAAGVQTGSTDSSYAAMFAPWIIVPGLANTNPSVLVSPVFSRTVAPCALAAALVAVNDSTNDANVPAAGVKSGKSTFATGVSTVYSDADRGNLNTSGVNVIRLVPNVGVIALYGFQSLAFAPAWAALNNVRFRMQITRDLDAIGEGFVFREIDGKGHIFSSFGGALSGQLQAYWARNSLYGLTADLSFSVNVGASVNTPTTIAAGQLNAAVAVRMAPFAEFVTINITKYISSAPLPL
jgi:hypothetical protein